jgi:hypothetical protein
LTIVASSTIISVPRQRTYRAIQRLRSVIVILHLSHRADEFSATKPSLYQMDIGLETVDALARLQLALRRAGGELRVVGPPEELRELIAFVGLEDVLVVEPQREAEQREEGLGVEEEAELGDLAL